MAENSDVVVVNDETFESAIAMGVALVDFYAEWCGPCRILAPILEQVAAEMRGKAKFVKVDTDHAEKVAGNYRITSIPTLILFKDGKEINRVVGLRDAQGIRTLVSSAL